MKEESKNLDKTAKQQMILYLYKDAYTKYLKTNSKKHLKECIGFEKRYLAIGGSETILRSLIEEINFEVSQENIKM